MCYQTQFLVVFIFPFLKTEIYYQIGLKFLFFTISAMMGMLRTGGLRVWIGMLFSVPSGV